MKIGIHSFASLEQPENNSADHRHQTIRNLLDRIHLSDEYGLDFYGIGEHHRREYLDSAAHNILSAASSLTKNIILKSSVAVLSAADPVRLFQNYATLDLLSKGRVQMVVGRASFRESFPLFGLSFDDYNELFEEKLDLLLKIRDNTAVTWSGKFRPSLSGEEVHPRPYQQKIPIWIGVGGTPQSVVRAAKLGLPLMIAIIGGETHRFRPLCDLYRQTWIDSGFKEEDIQIGVHSLGFVGTDGDKAREDFFHGYKKSFTKIGLERGWGPVTRQSYDFLVSETGALVVGDPSEVVEKIKAHSDSLGGITQFAFQMSVAELSHQQLSDSIKLIGDKVIPLLKS